MFLCSRRNSEVPAVSVALGLGEEQPAQRPDGDVRPARRPQCGEGEEVHGLGPSVPGPSSQQGALAPSTQHL